MKKFIILLFTLIIACEFTNNESNEIKIGAIYDYDFPNDIPDFKTIQEAIKYLFKNSMYIDDETLYGKEEYLETPEEFYNNRFIWVDGELVFDENGPMYGDCDGHTTILQYVLDTRLSLYSEYVSVKHIGEKERHAIAYIPSENIYIDLLNPIITNIEDLIMTFEDVKMLYEDFYYIPYQEILWMAVYYHRVIRN